MILWIDAQLSPHLAPWLSGHFDVEALSARRLGLRDAKDQEIFAAARQAGVVVMTKDRDFVSLVERQGPPPQVLWITAGNTSNAHLKVLFGKTLATALGLLQQGEALVEIGEPIARAGE